MKNLLFSTIALIAFTFAACQSNDPKVLEQDAKWHEVMKVHDEGMAEMGKITSLQSKLEDVVKARPNLDSLQMDQISKVNGMLQNADDGMMDWMTTLEHPSKMRDEKTHEEIMQYLEGQAVKAEKVKADIAGSIAGGQALIDNLKVD